MQMNVKLYIRPDRKNKKGFVYYIDDAAHTSHWPRDADIHIGDVDVMLALPTELNEDELRRRAIMTLRDKQATIRANAHKEVELLEEKINQLTLLVHIVPEEVTGAV